MLNKVMLIGNLGRDPEVRHLESGAVVAKFSIATNERYKDKAGEVQTQTEWHDIIMWRGLAELAERLLNKGKLVYVEGKLTTRKWQDNNGNDRYTTEVVANNFQILEKRENSGFNASGFPTEAPAATKTPKVTGPSDANSSPSVVADNPAPAMPETTKVQGPEDDLPF